MKELSVIIPTYRGSALLLEFLPSVLAALRACPCDAELVIVDDCSGDDSLSVARRLCEGAENVVLGSTAQNSGFSGACNRGAELASGRILFFLNNDVRLEPDYFKNFQKYFADDTVFAVACSGYSFFDSRQIDGVKTVSWKRGFPRFTKNIYDEKLPDEGEILSFGFQGAYFFARADRFRALGGFDELYAPYIMEETDLAFRAIRRGWKVVYGRGFMGYHKVGSSIHSKTSRRTKIISARNRLLFVWKNIRSPKLLCSHFFFLFLRLLTLDLIQWQALFKALPLMSRAISSGKKEAALSVETDGRIISRYENYFRKLGR